MKSVCNVNLDKFFPEHSEKENVNDYVFNCEMTFQFALAWFLKEQLGAKIKNIEFEKNVYCNIYDEDKKEEDNRRCDIVVNYENGKEALIELKYVVEGLDNSIKVSNNSRESFMKDLCRLKFDPLIKDVAEKYCIFITNMSAVFEPNHSKKIFTEFFNIKFSNKKNWDYTNWHITNNKKWKKSQFQPYILVVNVNDNQITNEEWKQLKTEYNKRLEAFKEN